MFSPIELLKFAVPTPEKVRAPALAALIMNIRVVVPDWFTSVPELIGVNPLEASCANEGAAMTAGDKASSAAKKDERFIGFRKRRAYGCV